MKNYLAMILVLCAALPTLAQKRPSAPPPREEPNGAVMVKPAPKKQPSNISMGQVRPASTDKGSVQPANRPNNYQITSKPPQNKPEPLPSITPKQKLPPQAKPATPAPKPEPKPQTKPAAPKPEPKHITPAPKPEPKHVAPAPKPEPKHVAPAPKPEPKHVPAPPVGHHPDFPDRKDYKPGHHNHPLPPPFDRHYYQSWEPLRWKHTYSYDHVPLTMQYNLPLGKKMIFFLEENTTTGYAWFARYDERILDIDIEHQGSMSFFGFAGRPGRAEIKIRGRNEGYTVVELIYARSWEWRKGEPPAKVIQIFINCER